MVLRFLTRLSGTTSEPVPDAKGGQRPLQAGERIYAIGDIHGCAHLLDAMRDLIRADLSAQPAKAEIVYLGDYVDRGPDVAGTLERVASPPHDLPPAVALKGNHEHVLQEFLAGADYSDVLQSFGGFETLRSYGIEPTSIPGRNWIIVAREQLTARMPASHRALLDGLALSYDRPPYFFCHAGVQPGIPVGQQTEDALIWIRDDFLRSTANFGRIVVHGHTPVPKPDVRENRIAVDTRAYGTGILSCAVLEIGAVRFLQTTPS